jgi:aminopeptidase N
LTAFNLDFAGLTVDAVAVNGVPASHTRDGSELTIVPQVALDAGRSFETVIRYHGIPKLINAVTTIGDLRGLGWFHADNGAISVFSEPNGAASWHPVNDHPADKATYRIAVTVPKPWVAAVSGKLLEAANQGAATRYVFAMDRRPVTEPWRCGRA